MVLLCRGVTPPKGKQARAGTGKMPYQIECFDNSNISGTDAVAGCIVYKGMKPV